MSDAPSASRRGRASPSSGPPPRRVAAHADRRQHRTRLLGVLGLAVVAFAAGVLVSTRHSSDRDKLAVGFVRAWTRGDYAAMYIDTDAATQHSLSIASFSDSYRSALRLATVAGVALAGHPRNASDGSVGVPVLVRTRLFGPLSLSFHVPTTGSGDTLRVRWSRSLLFPGLSQGETLSRHLELPPRATLLARDGSVLASGPASSAGGVRESPLGAAADTVIGSTGPIPPTELQALVAQGVPSTADVGLSGIELALDSQLRGRAGGVLMAGGRVLASVTPQASAPVRTTISPPIQEAAVQALGNQLGGVVVMRPSDGEILAVAGLGIDDVQPPGSTFKMITLTGVLQYGVAGLHSNFPYQTSAVLDGVQLQNANGESCGGSLALAFAVSCNSVFAPLGAKLGASRLVGTAERFGFNQPPVIPGAAESTIPPASQITGDLAVGSSAIGQDEVQASVLEMALVASTIADHGRRPQPTFMLDHHLPRVTVTSPDIARIVRSLMIDVVREGTGTHAAIPGVTVAGKTGTAELTTTAPTCPVGEQPGSPQCPSTASNQSNPRNTDAWFAAFAPALDPRVAVGVLLVRDGAGGDTAAPVARAVLESALANSS